MIQDKKGLEQWLSELEQPLKQAPGFSIFSIDPAYLNQGQENRTKKEEPMTYEMAQEQYGFFKKRVETPDCLYL
ncbi:hypothetical protein FJZ53_02475 [Candidatus Woesearchaeota archaeon]|nr:hypothetical protein [Candidatus Woesearchaeota archaeon]